MTSKATGLGRTLHVHGRKSPLPTYLKMMNDWSSIHPLSAAYSFDPHAAGMAVELLESIDRSSELEGVSTSNAVSNSTSASTSPSTSTSVSTSTSKVIPVSSIKKKRLAQQLDKKQDDNKKETAKPAENKNVPSWKRDSDASRNLIDQAKRSTAIDPTPYIVPYEQVWEHVEQEWNDVKAMLPREPVVPAPSASVSASASASTQPVVPAPSASASVSASASTQPVVPAPSVSASASASVPVASPQPASESSVSTTIPVEPVAFVPASGPTKSEQTKGDLPE
jgi:hypothetical protein